jgi:hypothetical protein
VGGGDEIVLWWRGVEMLTCWCWIWCRRCVIDVVCVLVFLDT